MQLFYIVGGEIVLYFEIVVIVFWNWQEVDVIFFEVFDGFEDVVGCECDVLDF